MNDDDYQLYSTPYKPNLYSNCFTQQYRNEQLALLYKNFQLQFFNSSPVRMILMVSLSLTCQIIVLILSYTILTNKNREAEIIVLRYFQITTLIICVLSFVYYFVFTKLFKTNIRVYTSYMILSCLGFVLNLNSLGFLITDYTDDMNNKLPNPYKLFGCLFIKGFYCIVIDNNFLQFLILNMIGLFFDIWYEIKYFVYSDTGFRFSSSQNFIGALVFAFITITSFSYYHGRSHKDAFYFKKKIIKTNILMTGILNQMENGIIIYKRDLKNKTSKIKYLNNFARLFKQFRKVRSESLGENEVFYLENNINTEIVLKPTNTLDQKLEYSNYDFFNIFESIEDLNPKLDEEVSELLRSRNLEEILKKIENPRLLEYFKDFQFLGTASIEGSSYDNPTIQTLYHLNLYLKSYLINDKISYEIIMNDVTRTKILEENKTKVKSLMLAKISHEFKNPLIVVNETVDQAISQEEMKGKSKMLRFIKNLCNYMILLVKYFESISNIENKIKLNLNPEPFNIRKELEYLKEIAMSLMHKNNILDNVDFNLIVDSKVPTTIKIDKMRIQQILINLLSNSIKFTNYGYINLIAEMVDDQTEPETRIRENLHSNYSKPKSQKSSYKVNHFNTDDDISHKSSVLSRRNDEEIVEIHPPEKKILRFSVVDTGKGIKKEEEKNLFDGQIKDNSLKNVLGSGYGLNIVNDICKLFNSRINYVKNEPNGSVFYFDINIEDLTIREIGSSLLNASITSELEVSIAKKRQDNDEIFEDKMNPMNLVNIEEQKSEDKIATRTDIHFFRGVNKGQIDNMLKTRKETRNKSLKNITESTIRIEERCENSNDCMYKEKSLEISAQESLLITAVQDCLNLKLKITNLKFGQNSNVKKLTLILVDDEEIIRRSIKRLIETYFKKKEADIQIIEASDGLETITAIYLCQKRNIKIDAIISDETMSFVNGSHSSQIISKLVSLEITNDVPIYICTAYGSSIDKSRFSSLVRKIYSKPIDLHSLGEVMSTLLS